MSLAELTKELIQLKDKFGKLEYKVMQQEKIILEAHEKIESLLNPDYSKGDESRILKTQMSKPIRLPSFQTHYRTCYELYEAYTDIGREVKSGMFWLDLDGPGQGEPPIYVYCNLTDGIRNLSKSIFFQIHWFFN